MFLRLNFKKRNKDMVHLFSQQGYNIALDSASGAVHVLTGIAAEMLKLL